MDLPSCIYLFYLSLSHNSNERITRLEKTRYISDDTRTQNFERLVRKFHCGDNKLTKFRNTKTFVTWCCSVEWLSGNSWGILLFSILVSFYLFFVGRNSQFLCCRFLKIYDALFKNMNHEIIWIRYKKEIFSLKMCRLTQQQDYSILIWH